MNQDEILTSDQDQLEIAIQPPDQQPDLAEFTSTIVHDLQAPLRSLTMFTELLAEEYQDKLDQKAQQYLDRICDSSSRMQGLIEDLLTYSCAGKGEQTWIIVDLNQIVDQIKSDLQSAIAETNAEITVKNLPQVLINPREIHQLFQNLIENAIKYSGAETPQIEVTAIAQEQEWLFAIADNGIGIAAEFQSQIFDVFQRLHPADVYSGSGMGLAICKKIVKRYGGNIWVESSGVKGSTFYFTLPMNTRPQSPNAKVT